MIHPFEGTSLHDTTQQYFCASCSQFPEKTLRQVRCDQNAGMHVETCYDIHTYFQSGIMLRIQMQNTVCMTQSKCLCCACFAVQMNGPYGHLLMCVVHRKERSYGIIGMLNILLP